MIITLFLLLVGAILPALAWSSYRYLADTSIEREKSPSTSALAIQSLVIHGIVGSLAYAAARSAGLTILFIEGTVWIHAATAFGLFAAFVLLARYESKRPLTEREVLRKQLRKEGLSAQWILVIVAASFVEEFAYRGVLYLLLASYVPAPVAVLISAVLFGLGHFSQGVRGAVASGLSALAMSGLFLLSGTLVLPIVVHLLYDLTISWMGRRAANNEGELREAV